MNRVLEIRTSPRESIKSHNGEHKGSASTEANSASSINGTHSHSEVGVLRMSPRRKVVEKKQCNENVLHERNYSPLVSEKVEHDKSTNNKGKTELIKSEHKIRCKTSIFKENDEPCDINSHSVAKENQKDLVTDSAMNKKKYINNKSTSYNNKLTKENKDKTATKPHKESAVEHSGTSTKEPAGTIDKPLAAQKTKNEMIKKKSTKGKKSSNKGDQHKTNKNNDDTSKLSQELSDNAVQQKSSKNNDDISKLSQEVDDLSIKTSKLLMTDYYPIRRSCRKTKTELQKETEEHIISAVINKEEVGLKVVDFPSKGRGVVTTKQFCKGEFIVEYAGDIISWEEASKRESEYASNPQVGCYMYYYTAKGKNYCVDATAETGRFGRLLNHSRKKPNCFTKLVWIPSDGDADPRLVLHAKRNIAVGEELTFDYGDRDKKAVKDHPWLKL